MWYQSMVALDLARDRARQAQAEAARWRFELELAHRATAPTRRPGWLRRTAAGAMRWVSDVTITVSDAACAAAARIEGRTA